MTKKVPEWFTKATGATLGLKDTLQFPKGQYSLWEGAWTPEKYAFSAKQEQTAKTFGFKWKQEETFKSEAVQTRVQEWLTERYGDVEAWMKTLGTSPVVLDAGCGAALSALEYFKPVFNDINYIGVDVSEAAQVASKQVKNAGFSGVFMQEDLTNLPFAEASMDCIFSEGVLHHTDSTRGALEGLCPLLKPGGLFMFYVYKTKGPIREFTDDYIRDELQNLSPEEAWKELEPLTDLGIQLGKLDAELDFPEGFPLLGIPAGKINLQRFFYWHICKAFYRDDHNFDELHHINFDWFAPRNAHRQTPQEVETWCRELGLSIERLIVENAGITVVARKL